MIIFQFFVGLPDRSHEGEIIQLNRQHQQIMAFHENEQGECDGSAMKLLAIEKEHRILQDKISQSVDRNASRCPNCCRAELVAGVDVQLCSLLHGDQRVPDVPRSVDLESPFDIFYTQEMPEALQQGQSFGGVSRFNLVKLQ